MNLRSLFLDNLTTKQTIFKNTFWLVFAEGISKVLMFFLTILIARYLGAEGYGKFSFAFAFIALFGILTDFGFSTLTIRELARDKRLVRRYIDNLAVIKLILGAITFGLILIIIQFFGKPPEVKTLVYLAAIWIIIQSFTQFFRSIFRAFAKMQYEAASKIVYSVTLLTITLFVIRQNLGIKILVQGYTYAALVGFLITLILIRNHFTKFWIEINLTFWKSLFKEAWPFALIAVFVMIYFRIDTIMLSVIKGDEITGWYNAAYNPIFALLLIPDIFNASIFPLLSKYTKKLGKFKEIYRLALKIILIIGLFITIGLMALAHPVIKIAYGADYLNSITAFRILLLSFLIICGSTITSYALIAKGRQKFVTYCAGLGSVINIFLNLLLIPLLSLIGAAIATTITQLIIFLIYFYTIEGIIKSKNERGEMAEQAVI